MRTMLASLLVGSALLSPGSAPTQTYPGQPTQGKVWVQNRGSSEAVPISLQQIAGDATMKVQITGTPSVAIATPSVFDTRRARQAWEYQRISLQPEDDPSSELTRLGREGWETTLQWVTPRGSLTIILKRPR
jgi:hypothetical protein